MRSALMVVAGLSVACGGSSSSRPSGELGITTHSELAADESLTPTYPMAELERVLIAERGREAASEHQLAELEAKAADDELRIARADLEVHRRFITSLEHCQASGHECPPRLDDPPWTFDVDTAGAKPSLDTPLRFDLEDWRRIAVELHGRACACRTLACVDGVGVAIDQLEERPMQDVKGDDISSASITRARECLFRLRGKTITKHVDDSHG